MKTQDLVTSLRGKTGLSVGEGFVGVESVSLEPGQEKQIEKWDSLDFVILDAGLFMLLPVKYLFRQLKSRLKNHGLIILRVPADPSPLTLHRILSFGDIEFVTQGDGFQLFRLVRPASALRTLLQNDALPLRYKIADAANDAMKTLGLASLAKQAVRKVLSFRLSRNS